MIGGVFSSIPKAHAALISGDFDFARQVVTEVTPMVTSLSQDEQDSAVLSFAPDGYLSKPLVIETIVTPERKTTASLNTAIKSVKNMTPKVKLATVPGNHFAYGYCTWYVASERNIPWFGNAGTWLTGARAYGFTTGSTPQVGEIIVTSESHYGHVGIVESVNGDGTITILEMNYSGFARISSRTILTSYRAIKGYIY